MLTWIAGVRQEVLQTFSVAEMWQKHCEKTSPTSCYPGQSLTEYLWPSVMTAAS